MKTINSIATLLFTLAFTHTALPAVFLSEGFENGGAIPAAWTQEYAVGALDWTFEDGGHLASPPSAYAGSYNALFYGGSYDELITRLITPAINFGANTNNPTLSFQHCQVEWAGDQDILKVCYRTFATGAWILLQEYATDVTSWTERTISLPNAGKSYCICFEGVNGYGYGVCIDDVIVYEDVPRVELFPGEQDRADFPGERIDSPLAIENETGANDSFALSYVSDPWPETGPANSGLIVDGGATTVTVSVEVPSTASAGQSSTTTVTAVGVADNSLTGTAVIIARCTWQKQIIHETFDTGLPAGWSNYRMGEFGGRWKWQDWGGNPDGCMIHDSEPYVCTNWYVSPAIDLSANYDEIPLTFDERQFDDWKYNYSGVWISTGERNPATGDYVQLLEIGQSSYTYVNRKIDLRAYIGESNVYIAFLYIGYADHKQYIDNLYLTGLRTGIGNAALASPASITMNSYQSTPTITATLFINGETGVSGPAENVTAEVGYGLRDSAPGDTWNWTTAAYIGSDGTNDLFATNMFVTVSGEQDYAYRFRQREETWVYADLDGSTNGYSSDAAGKMLISNCVPQGQLLLDQTIPDRIISAPFSCYQAPSNAPPFYQELADDFSFSYCAAVKSVQWGGAYSGDGRKGLERGFWLRIYNNATTDTTNHPGNLLYAEFKPGYACELWRTNDAGFGCDIYEYNATLATLFSVVGGSTYWFSIQDVVTSDTYWSWFDSPDDVQGNPSTWTPDNVFGTNSVTWEAGNSDLGFKLYGQKEPNVYLDPTEQTSEGLPGDRISYHLVITNQTGSSDTFSLSYDSVWDTSGPANTGEIMDGGWTTITVNVDIPTTAGDGQTVASIVRAAGTSNPGFTNSAIVITVAMWDQEIYCQDFEGAWPPTGWTNFQLGDASMGWRYSSPGANGTGTCAYHRYSSSLVMCDDWLVSCPIDLSTGVFDTLRLEFYTRLSFSGEYYHSYVMISTGSSDPSVGDYVQLLEVGNADTDWTLREIDLSAYQGSSPVYIAFRYQGANAHTWYVDDACVIGRAEPSSGFIRGTVTAAHSGAPIVNANVIVDNGTYQWIATTDVSGNYLRSAPTNTYDVSAAAMNYATGTVSGITITEGSTNVQDFALAGSMLTYGPSAIEETLPMCGVVTNSIVITNSGPVSVDYRVLVFNFTEPSGTVLKASASSRLCPLSLGPGSLCYGFDIWPGTNRLVSFDAGTPAALNDIGNAIADGDFISGADFLIGDFSKLYAITSGTNQFLAVNTANGATTVIGTPTPGFGEHWSGMAGDQNGTLYASSLRTDLLTKSRLYTIDPETGNATLVGMISNDMTVVDIAINSKGEMYGLDTQYDNLVRIDKETGVGTVVGAIGFNARYAQGMDFDESSDTLYLAAYNFTTANGELRIADVATGNTTNVGPLGDGAIEIDGFAIAALPERWATVSTNAGTVAAGAVGTFDVIFDAGIVSNAGEYTADLSFSGTFVNNVPNMPLTMRVVDTPVIDVSTDVLTFPDTVVYETNVESFVVANIGAGILTGEVQNVAAPFSVASSGSYMLASLSSQSVSFVFAPVDEGDYTNIVALTGGGGATVTLVGTAVPEPIMFVIVYVLACLAAGRKRATGAA